MDFRKKFEDESKLNIEKMSKDKVVKSLSKKWVEAVSPYKWAYNFNYLGIPAIQFPNDVWAFQEIIWKTKPDLIIETGVAHGGSLIFSSSMLALLDISETVNKQKVYNPKKSKRKVIGIDIDIREHNRKAISNHPFSYNIILMEGSSLDKNLFDKVEETAKKFNRIMVILDSNHTHDHVLTELNLYSKLVTKNLYCIVLDTLIEDMPDKFFSNRPWGKGNNPKTAVYKFLQTNSNYVIDKSFSKKLSITVAPDGFLKRIN